MTRLSLAAALASLLPALATAEAPAAYQERRELAGDRYELHDARRDVARFEELLARYDDAVAAGVKAIFGPGTSVPKAARQILDLLRENAGAAEAAASA